MPPMGVLLKCELSMGALAGNNQAQDPEVAADSTWAWMLPAGGPMSNFACPHPQKDCLEISALESWLQYVSNSVLIA